MKEKQIFNRKQTRIQQNCTEVIFKHNLMVENKGRKEKKTENKKANLLSKSENIKTVIYSSLQNAL